MTFQFTKPDADQVKFSSSRTGEWVLEDYLQAAEYGNKSLSTLLGMLFDDTGTFKNVLITGVQGIVIGTISATEPTATFAGQVWLKP
jgi:hypothetical protein